MNAAEFDQHTQELLDLAHSIATAKRPGYTQGNADVLKNFKDAAALLPGLSPTQAWGVYFYKHVAAILSWAGNPDIAQAEVLEGRFADAINYLKLGFGLFKEQQGVPEATDRRTGLERRIDWMESQIGRCDKLGVDVVPFLDRIEAGIQDILIEHGITDEAAIGSQDTPTAEAPGGLFPTGGG